MQHTVVVHKVSNRDTEQGTLQSSVKAAEALALHNPLDRLDGVGVGLLGLDLRSGRQRDQGISALCLSMLFCFAAYARGD